MSGAPHNKPRYRSVKETSVAEKLKLSKKCLWRFPCNRDVATQWWVPDHVENSIAHDERVTSNGKPTNEMSVHLFVSWVLCVRGWSYRATYTHFISPPGSYGAL